MWIDNKKIRKNTLNAWILYEIFTPFHAVVFGRTSLLWFYMKCPPPGVKTNDKNYGKLSHPPEDLYDLSLYYYAYFKSRNPKCCRKVFLEAYNEIYSATDYEFENIASINRRFSNCFFKAFVKKESSKIKSDERKKNMKKRKLAK